MPSIFIPRDLFSRFQGDAIDQQATLVKEDLQRDREPVPPTPPPAPTPSDSLTNPLGSGNAPAAPPAPEPAPSPSPPSLEQLLATAGLGAQPSGGQAAVGATPAAAPTSAPPLQDLLQLAGLGDIAGTVGNAAGAAAASLRGAGEAAVATSPPPLQDVLRSAGLATAPTSTAQPAAAEQVQNVQDAVAQVGRDVSMKTGQFEMGLSDDDAYAFCGPAAAIAFAQAYGRNPTTAEAKKLAQQVGWSASQGMAGVASEQSLLQEMGIPTKLEQDVDWSHVAQDASSGNPVILSTPGHYFYVSGVRSGRNGTQEYYVGKSGTALKRGGEWMTAEDMQTQMGQVSGALYADNPSTPNPSVAAGPQSSMPQPSTPTTAGLSGGGDLSGRVGDRGNWIMGQAANAASWLGEQGQKAVQAVLLTEGGLNNARGDNGQSAGPLQFFEGGQLANFARQMGQSLDQAKAYVEAHPVEAVQWAIGTASNPGYLGKVIADGISRGISGPDLATYAQQHGQVSVSPERAGANWSSLFGGGQATYGQGANRAPNQVQGPDFAGLAQRGTDLAKQGATLAAGLMPQQQESPDAAVQREADQRLATLQNQSATTLAQGQSAQAARSVAASQQPPYQASVGGGLMGRGAFQAGQGNTPEELAAPNSTQATAVVTPAAPPPQPDKPLWQSIGDSIGQALQPLVDKITGTASSVASDAGSALQTAFPEPTGPASVVPQLATAESAGRVAQGALSGIGHLTEAPRTAAAESPVGRAAGEFFARTGGPSEEYPSGGPWSGPLYGAPREMAGQQQLGREFEQRTGMPFAQFEEQGHQIAAQLADGTISRDDPRVQDYLRLQDVWNQMAGDVGSDIQAYARAPESEKAQAEALGGATSAIATTALVPGAIEGNVAGAGRAALSAAIDPGSAPFLGIQALGPATEALGRAGRGVSGTAANIVEQAANYIPGTPEARVEEIMRPLAQASPDGLAHIDGQELLDRFRALNGNKPGPFTVNRAEAKGGTNVLLNAGGLPGLDDIRALVEAGMVHKDWYINFADRAAEAVGEQNIPEFFTLFAITSSQTKVKRNVWETLNTMQKVREVATAAEANGQDVEKAVVDLIRDKSRLSLAGKTANQKRAQIEKAYLSGISQVLSGAKTSSYAGNLDSAGRRLFDPRTTNDVWVWRAFNVSDEEKKVIRNGEEQTDRPWESAVASSDPAYRFTEAVLNEVAREKGLQGHQVQAAMWASINSMSTRAKDLFKRYQEGDFQGAIADMVKRGVVAPDEAYSDAVFDTPEIRKLIASGTHLKTEGPLEAANMTRMYAGPKRDPRPSGAAFRESERNFAESRAPIASTGSNSQTLERAGLDPATGTFPWLTVPHRVSDTPLGAVVHLPGGNSDTAHYVGAELASRAGLSDYTVHAPIANAGQTAGLHFTGTPEEVAQLASGLNEAGIGGIVATTGRAVQIPLSDELANSIGLSGSRDLAERIMSIAGNAGITADRVGKYAGTSERVGSERFGQVLGQLGGTFASPGRSALQQRPLDRVGSAISGALGGTAPNAAIIASNTPGRRQRIAAIDRIGARAARERGIELPPATQRPAAPPAPPLEQPPATPPPGGLLPGAGEGSSALRPVAARAAVGGTGAAISEQQRPESTPESVARAAVGGAAFGAARSVVGRQIPGLRLSADVGRVAAAIGGPPGSARSFDLDKLAQMRRQFQAAQPPLLNVPARATAIDRFIGYTAANMLSGVGTAIQNTIGNVVQMGTRPLVTAAGGHPVDAVRDVAAMMASISDAFAAYGGTFASGQRASQSAQHSLQAPVGSLKNPLNVPMRNLAATDEFFRTLNSAGAAASEASRRLRENPGLSFDDVLQRYAGQIVDAGTDGAARGVFERGGGVAGYAGEQIARGRQALLRSNDPGARTLGLAMQWLLPMTRVPGVILGEGVRMLPVVNEVRGAQQTIQMARRGEGYQASRELGRTYLTSMLNFAILSEVAQGNITGDGPENPTDRQRLMEAVDADGNATWRPNSIRLPGGKWIDYSGLGPVAITMSSIANTVDEAMDVAQKPAEMRGAPSDVVVSLLNREARTLGNAWYLRGLADVLSAVKEGTIGGSVSSFASAGDRLVPASTFLNEMRHIQDDWQREPGNVLEREANRIPFASRLVKPRLSATTGQPLEAPEDWFSTLVRGTPSGSMTPNPVAAEIARLDEGGDRVSVPYEVKSFKGARQSDEQQQAIHEQIGTAVNMYVLDTMGKPQYASLTDRQKADALRQAVGQAQEAANITLSDRVARSPHESALLQWAQVPHFYGVKGSPEDVARKNWEIEQARAKLSDYRKQYGEAGETRFSREDHAAYLLSQRYEPVEKEVLDARKRKIDQATGGLLSQEAGQAQTGGLVGVGATTLAAPRAPSAFPQRPPQRP